jgi:hypothetical protein
VEALAACPRAGINPRHPRRVPHGFYNPMIGCKLYCIGPRRTWSAAVHDGQLTWNQEAGADVPKPLGMAAGRRLAAQHAERERTRPFPWENRPKNPEVLRAPYAIVHLRPPLHDPALEPLTSVD